MKLTCKLRKSTIGKELCVAPFINDYNVWDIPVKEWTPDVQKAVLHAYELGVEQAFQLLSDDMKKIYRNTNAQASWPKPTKETK